MSENDFINIKNRALSIVVGVFLLYLSHWRDASISRHFEQAEFMKNVVFSLNTWAAMVCVAMAGMWLSNASVAGVIKFGSGGNTFEMTFVPIGNANNADDTTGNPSVAGKVEYAYQMGKYEVSEDMITKYNAEFGSANGLVITKDTRGTNKPATSVSWNEAARFVNWLNTSKGFQAAYNFTSGGVNDNIALWNVGDGFALGGSSENLFRHKDAHFWLPSLDEWYKAAYYDPTANGGLGAYFNYPNGSDTAPMAVTSGMDPNTAVFNQDIAQGPADVMSAGGLSPYGIMGLGGNAFE